MVTRIVVGIDGSEHSKRALRRAVKEAQLREARVDAVLVYGAQHRTIMEAMSGWSGGFLSNPERSDEERAESNDRRALQALAADIETALEGVDGPTPHLVTIPSDDPAEALIEHSAGADMLVLGTRGHGGITGSVLGSVAQAATRHARCPVLVLPPNVQG